MLRSLFLLKGGGTFLSADLGGSSKILK